MEKNKSLFSIMGLIAIVCILIVSCASVSTVSGKEWYDTMSAPEDTADYHFEFGYGTGSTLITAKKFAEAQANSAIAQWVNNSIDTITTTYINDAGSGVNTQAVQAFEELSKQHASAVLTGVKTIDTYQYDVSDGYAVGVIVQIPIGTIAESLKETVEEAFVKNEASEEANRMMNEAIAKYFGL